MERRLRNACPNRGVRPKRKNPSLVDKLLDASNRNVYPPNMPKLSGTYFMVPKEVADGREMLKIHYIPDSTQIKERNASRNPGEDQYSLIYNSRDFGDFNLIVKTRSKLVENKLKHAVRTIFIQNNKGKFPDQDLESVALGFVFHLWMALEVLQDPINLRLSLLRFNPHIKQIEDEKAKETKEIVGDMRAAMQRMQQDEECYTRIIQCIKDAKECKTEEELEKCVAGFKEILDGALVDNKAMSEFFMVNMEEIHLATLDAIQKEEEVIKKLKEEEEMQQRIQKETDNIRKSKRRRTKK